MNNESITQFIQKSSETVNSKTVLVNFDLKPIKDWTSLRSSTWKVTQTEQLFLNQLATVRAIDVKLTSRKIYNCYFIQLSIFRTTPWIRLAFGPSEVKIHQYVFCCLRIVCVCVCVCVFGHWFVIQYCCYLRPINYFMCVVYCVWPLFCNKVHSVLSSLQSLEMLVYFKCVLAVVRLPVNCVSSKLCLFLMVW